MVTVAIILLSVCCMFWKNSMYVTSTRPLRIPIVRITDTAKLLALEQEKEMPVDEK